MIFLKYLPGYIEVRHKLGRLSLLRPLAELLCDSTTSTLFLEATIVWLFLFLLLLKEDLFQVCLRDMMPLYQGRRL